MRGFWSVLLILLGSLPAAQADTTWVAGGTVAGGWDRDHSPYIVQGDITVAGEDSLEIGPGVRVYFAGPFHLQVDSLGFFRIHGAEGDSVVLTTDTLANPARWYGLQVRAARDTLRLDYCVIEFVGLDPAAPPGEDRGSTIRNTPLQLRHSALRYNRGQNEGGALSVEGTARAEFSDCVFTGNAGFHGGAAQLRSPAIVRDCLFQENSAAGGGALSAYALSPNDSLLLERCTFRNNCDLSETTYSGGAVILEFTRVLLRNCRFEANSARYGGAVHCTFTLYPVHAEACQFFGNSAAFDGGAIYGQGAIRFARCVFHENTARNGGGIYLTGTAGSPIVERCTLVGNTATEHGGGIFLAEMNIPATLRDNIIALTGQGEAIANPPVPGGLFRNNDFYSNVGGNFWHNPRPSSLGVVNQVNANGDSCDAYQNLYRNPLFVNSAEADFHLMPHSPCVDAGYSGSVPDPDGTVADLGAFYVSQPPGPPGPFDLLSPADSIVIQAAGPVEFCWQTSTDPDYADEPVYTVRMTSAIRSWTHQLESDTCFLTDPTIRGFGNPAWVTWWIEAYSVYPETSVVSLTQRHFYLDVLAADAHPELPAALALHPATPNPFNAVTVISFDLPQAGPVSLRIYNLLGEEVGVLVHDVRAAGQHAVSWNATDFSSGVYFAVLAAGNEYRVRKIALLK